MAGSSKEASGTRHTSTGAASEPGSGAGGEASPDRAPGATNGHVDARRLEALIDTLLRFGTEAIGSADCLIEVYRDRVRLSARRTLAQVAIRVGLAVLASVWLGAAAFATLRGVCGGLTAMWGGREWLGDLTGGLLALALAASAAALFLRSSSRRELGRLRGKYERIRNEHDQGHESKSPADHAPAVPQTGGGVGDPGAEGLGATPD